MRDDGRPPLEKEPEIRIPLELLQEPGVTAAHVRCYAAIRSRAGFEPAKENFMRAWPSVATTAEDAGMNRRTVIRSIKWLQDRDYLLVEPRPGHSSLYTVILWPRWYRDLIHEIGRDEAIEALRDRMSELDQESRSGQAEAASENPRQTRATGRKSHGGYLPVVNDGRGDSQTTPQWQPDHPPSDSQTTPGVTAGPPRTVDQDPCSKIRVPKNRGATDAAPVPSVSHSQENNDNGHHERHHHNSLLGRGAVAAAARQGENERTFEERLAEARRKARQIIEDEPSPVECGRVSPGGAGGPPERTRESPR